MEIIKKEPGILLIEQYGKKYVRFDSGEFCSIILQTSITDEEYEKIMSNDITMTSVANYYSNRGLCSLEQCKYNLAKDYIKFTTNYSDEMITTFIEKLQTYADIFSEFYRYILSENFLKYPIAVEGYTAEQLNANFSLSPLGAYNYLIYLRNDPQKALADMPKIKKMIGKDKKIK